MSCFHADLVDEGFSSDVAVFLDRKLYRILKLPFLESFKRNTY